MREIKFRAWNEITKKYLKHSELSIGLKNLKVSKQGHLIYEQYTGLKDKNGVEIYEGDIIRCYEYKLNGLEVVKQNKSITGFDPFVTPIDYDEIYLKNSKVVIVSNIHENPEILETLE